ncbi:GNAT family N-acetyltransferase [Shewanella atlantica]|uniref:GNAT family N-acetyltransferase n=1 Tax=Shewanella atlantica TaxID=271099 RepID=UPI0037368775
MILRHLEMAHADFILNLLNTPGFLKNIGDRGVRDRLQAETYLLDGPLASYRQHGFGLYLVELKETGEPIGLCGLVKRPVFDSPDLGYALLPAYWGRGYALESAEAVLLHCKVLKIRRVLGIVSPGNDSSISVLEKVGMIFKERALWEEDNSQVLIYTREIDM